MTVTDLIVILILLLILGGAGFYVYRAKKSGRKCIGCPAGSCSSSSAQGGCTGHCGGCSCGCGSDNADE